MENIIILLIIFVISGAAIRYIYKAKKRGAKCIGCPGGCSGKGKCCECKDLGRS